MARLPATRRLAWAVALLLLPGAVPARAAAEAAAPQLWPTRSFHGEDYVSLRDFAERTGLQADWSRPDLALTLAERGRARFVFETNQKDFRFDGLRVFLGAPALLSRDSLWITRLDLIKIVAPLLHPADHLVFLPAAPLHTIVLDAGHGGVDPGTQNRRLGLNEKTFTLDVALRLAKLLEARGWRVLLIRDRDTELSKDKKADLLMRDEFANRHKADLYLSIHFNNAAPGVTGVETYVMTPQFMLSAGDEHGDDMTRVSFPGNRLDYANLWFGESLHRALVDGLKAPDRGFKHAREAVLRMLDCPGALVECAYLSNDAEAQRVATPEYRERIAGALASGIGNFAAALAALRPPPPPVQPAPLPGRPVTTTVPPPSH